MTQALPSQPAWRKSSYSGQQGGDCIEAAELSNAVGVRDSKDTGRGHLTVAPVSWSAMLKAIRAR
ncbi:DUF397 domain-containing protein [Embleya sp. AB8]|uniref:DUF397 domain-containing protein n=1 Tax=Embleya sp. AB8 TaxID=3156304 RepID=UPI003C77ED27